MLRLPPNIRPPAFLGINRASPQARGLQVVMLPPGGYRSLGSLPVSAANSGSVPCGADGRLAWQFVNSDSIVLPAAAYGDVSADDWSITMWARSDGDTSQHRALWRSATIANFGVYQQKTTGYVTYYNGGFFGTTHLATSGEWMLITVRQTSSGNTCDLFVNDEISYNDATGKSLVSQSIRIGFDTFGSQYWIGHIDDVRIYNYALSDADIARMYRYPYDLWYWPEHNIVPEQGAAPVTAANNLTLLGVG